MFTVLWFYMTFFQQHLTLNTVFLPFETAYTRRSERNIVNLIFIQHSKSIYIQHFSNQFRIKPNLWLKCSIYIILHYQRSFLLSFCNLSWAIDIALFLFSKATLCCSRSNSLLNRLLRSRWNHKLARALGTAVSENQHKIWQECIGDKRKELQVR